MRNGDTTKRYDGFISRRASGEDVARRLADTLRADGFELVFQDETGTHGDHPNHVNNANDLIKQTNFYIVLIGPELFVPESGWPGYQAGEVRTIAHMLTRDGPENEDTERFAYIVALLPSEGPLEGDQDHSLKRALGAAADTASADWMREHQFGAEIRNYDLISDQDRNSDIDHLAWLIRQACNRRRIFPKAKLKQQPKARHSSENGRTSETPPPEEEPAQVSAAEPAGIDLQEAEAKYVERSLTSWRRGIIDRRTVHDDERTVARMDMDSPFGFHESRLLLLSARHDPVGSSAIRTAPTNSVFELLFRRADKPFLLSGKPGAGKSTTLAMIAALLGVSAGDKNRTPHEHEQKIIDSLGRSARRHQDSGFFPIAMKATRMADALGDDLHAHDSVLDTIASELFVNARTDSLTRDQRRNLIAERMKEQPYAILIDGLDELFDEEKVQTIFAIVERLWEDLDGPGGGIKIVLSIRSAVRHDRTGIFDVLRLEQPTDRQIEEFFQDYGKATSLESPGLATRLQEQKNTKTGSDVSELFKTPLFLNAFCWYLRTTNEKFTGNHAKFFDEVITYLLSGNERVKQGTAFEHPPEHLRQYLRALAYYALDSRNSGNWHSIASCVAALHEAAGASGAPSLTDNEAKKLLDLLAVHTGLIAADGGGPGANYKFTIPLFCEILAGEWIQSRDLCNDILTRTEDLDALKKWDRPLAIVFNKLIDEGNVEQARVIPETILARAAGDTQALDPRGWLSSVKLILFDTAKNSYAEERRETNKLEPVFKLFAHFIIDHKKNWDLVTLDQVTSEFLELGLRSQPSLTQFAVSKLYQFLGHSFALGQGDWTQIDADGLRHLQISTRPVLSCEFMEFVADCETSSCQLSHWAHAPEDLRALKLDYGEKTKSEPWVDRAVDIWSRLEGRPAAPMTYVNWYEATAYARWLTDKHRADDTITPDQEYRLPVATEWQDIAAVVSNGRLYPWGSDKVDNSVANWRDTPIGAASVPGLFPASEPEGLYDFGTNVKTWSNTEFPGDQPSVWPPVETTEESLFAALGGSYRSRIEEVRLNAPSNFTPVMERKYDLGIRLLLDSHRKHSEPN